MYSHISGCPGFDSQRPERFFLAHVLVRYALPLFGSYLAIRQSYIHTSISCYAFIVGRPKYFISAPNDPKDVAKYMNNLFNASESKTLLLIKHERRFSQLECALPRNQNPAFKLLTYTRKSAALYQRRG
jgi:hypothetical protein